MGIVWALLFCLILIAGWLLTVLGMPGTWLMLAVSVVYAWLLPAGDSRWGIGWPIVAALLGLALLGELVELAAGALGVAKVGGSRRSAVLALAGSLVGGIAGFFIGLPIPVVGPVVAAVLFAGGGALIGAMLGESWKGRDLDTSWQVGKAAFWGRLIGTLAKTMIASVMVAVGLAALLLD
jgi:uncharacterized protein YqgC (DUF456 family)